MAEIRVAGPVVAGHEAGLHEALVADGGVEDETGTDPGVARQVGAGRDAPGPGKAAGIAQDRRAVEFDHAAEISTLQIGGDAEAELLRHGGEREGRYEGKRGPFRRTPGRGLAMSLALPASGLVFFMGRA